MKKRASFRPANTAAGDERMLTSGLKLSSTIAHPPVPRSMTDPIVSWAMTKESIEELWIRSTRSCSANSELLDLSLIVLLNGWNVDRADAQSRMLAKWRGVRIRWCRELGEMTECAIDIEMLHLGDDQQLRELSRFGTRLFVAV